MSEKVTATSSISLKRTQSVDKNTENEDYLPKKKRESAIRSENNLKMLIQNGQVDTHKQKVPPKKSLSLGKEARTETLATLISAGKFEKLDKLYIKTVAAASNGLEDVETSDSDLETLPLPQPKNRLESETPNETITTNTTNALDPKNTTKVLNPTNSSNLLNLTSTTKVSNLNNSFNVSNSTNSTKVPNPTSTTKVPNPKSTTKVPNLNNTLNISNSTSSIKVPNLTNISNVSKPTGTTEVPNQTNTSNVSNPEENKNVSNITNKEETSSQLGNNVTSNTSEPVDSSLAEVSSTNNLDQRKEEETDFDRNRSSLDAEVLALHNLILTLAPDKDDNGTENHRIVDINHIENILKTVLKVKSKLNAVYMQKSIKLRKSFESIQLFVPELKRGLTLPTLQELKEKSLAVDEEPKLLHLRQEQTLHKEKPSPQ